AVATRAQRQRRAERRLARQLRLFQHRPPRLIDGVDLAFAVTLAGTIDGPAHHAVRAHPTDGADAGEIIQVIVDIARPAGAVAEFRRHQAGGHAPQRLHAHGEVILQTGAETIRACLHLAVDGFVLFRYHYQPQVHADEYQQHERQPRQ